MDDHHSLAGGFSFFEDPTCTQKHHITDYTETAHAPTASRHRYHTNQLRPTDYTRTNYTPTDFTPVGFAPTDFTPMAFTPTAFTLTDGAHTEKTLTTHTPIERFSDTL